MLVLRVVPQDLQGCGRSGVAGLDFLGWWGMGEGGRRSSAGGFACPCHRLSQCAPLPGMKPSPGCKTSTCPSPSALGQAPGPFSSTSFPSPCFEDVLVLILLAQSLAKWSLRGVFSWELLWDTIYSKKSLQQLQHRGCFSIATSCTV